MHLIFLHGEPGVGKRTIASELADELGFAFMDSAALHSLLGPVFGYGSPKFNELRDDTWRRLMHDAMALAEDGLIASFTWDPSLPLDDFGHLVTSAQATGHIGLFLGLTCDDDERKGRVDNPNRTLHGKVDEFLLAEEKVRPPRIETPPLPGPSISINTTGESPEDTVQNILAVLPDDMKQNLLI